MTRWLAVTPLVALMVAVGAMAEDAQDKGDSTAEMAKLVGNWKLIRSESNGNLHPLGASKAGLFIEDGKIFWTTDGQERGGQKGELTVDASTSPKSIEVEVTRGGNIGKKLLGIYEIKGNKLTICWSEPDGEKRPRKFVTKKSVGAGAVLETYQALDDEKSTASEDAKEPTKGGGRVDAAATAKLDGNWKLTRKEHKGNLWPGVDRGRDGLFIEDGKIFWTPDGKEARGPEGRPDRRPQHQPQIHRGRSHARG